MSAITEAFEAQQNAIIGVIKLDTYEDCIVAMGALGSLASRLLASFPADKREERINTWFECIRENIAQYTGLSDAIHHMAKK